MPVDPNNIYADKAHDKTIQAAGWAHVFPISKGGSNEDDNLVAACVPCNRSKGAKTPEQWRGE